MTKTFLFFIALSTFSTLTNAQTSTITGNVIVNFNYTRNDPDVGAEIKLFDINKTYSLSTLDRDSIKSTSTDMNGNYTFQNVPPGNYYIYINSKGAIASPFQLYNDLKGYRSKNLKRISGFDFSLHKPELQNKIKLLFEEEMKLADEKKWKKYQKVENEMNKKITEYFESLPSGIRLFFDIISGKMAKGFKEITVKAGVNENYATTFKVLYN